MIDSGLLSPVRAGTEVEGLTSDEVWLQAMLDVEVALARAQVRVGMIPASSAEEIARHVRTGEIDLVELAHDARGAANPVVALVRALTALVPGEASDHVHRGSTSQDILDSATMLVSARVLRVLDRDLSTCAAALADMADEYRHTPMAGRTLGQHAVPITFGLKAASWLQLVLDARDRVRSVELPAQLGGAAGTLSAYVEFGAGTDLISAFADELGLAEPLLPWHVVRTPLADLGYALSFTASALGKIAADVQTLARTEIAEVAEPAAVGRGVSSAMPQKRNPVLATLITSAARQVPALAQVLTQALVAEDERSPGGWHAEWQPLRECLRLAGGAAALAAELVEGLEVFPERMASNLTLTDGGVVAERLAVVLTPLLGKVKAKQIVAQAAMSGDMTSMAEIDEKLFAPEGYLGLSAELVDRVLDRFRR